ncbi:restriction endonuclease subunit S [Halomonas sp. BM-2019]|uniref:restriction endonuclease subunit S n=1 Tax=Halomonas sp. BM-2019 TaxID=2811227 RepID=UPI001B3C3136|nr:MAG: restriction endonuclease subunit S [Halomonas sp. BM-2019]
MARKLSSENIPDGWKYDLLDRFAERCSGHTPSKSFPEYWNGGIKWVSLSDSHKLDRGYIFETESEISGEGIKNSSAELHPAETVLMTRDAGIGKSAVLKTPMAVSQHFIAWRCDNKSCLHSWFLYNWLQLHKAEFERQAVGSTIKTIGLPFFKRLKILVPPFEEQQKIVDILFVWDKAITETERLIEVSQQQRHALMQQLLTGKRRLPGFVEEWRLVSMGDIAKRISEKNNGQSDNVVTISGKRGLIRQTDFFNKSVASETLDGYTILRKGQFAYNKSYSDGYPMGAIKRLNLYDDAVVTSLYICFEVQASDACEEFMEHCFESGVLNRRLKKVAAEGGRAHGLLNVKPSDFFDLRLSLPPKEEQKAIAKVLSQADAEIEAQQRRLNCLRQEKKALMQQLLTGKRRVKVEATAPAEEAAC